LGMILSTIGGVPGVGEFRYTFGTPYLFNGLNLVVVALGIFALPEIVDMLTRGTQISEVPELGKGILEGIKDVLHNMKLVLKCSAIGAYIGFVPGLGQAVANWFAYGYAVNSCKNRENFGKGDIRGVIAPESANNASAGGALIPSVLFGIPGSGMMAILLAGFLILGIYPGRDMVTTHLNVTFSMVWSLTLANILACVLCMAFVKPLARVTTIKIHYIAPFILMIVILGAFQCTRHWGDLIAILILSILGWFMKRFGWARPPLLVGFILGGIAERYFYLSTMRYGAGWLLHPGVIIIACFIVVSLYMALRWRKPDKTGNK
jgi:putative tricarboxylic transport membrane protein